MSDYNYPRNLSHWRFLYEKVLRDHPQCFVDLAQALGVESFESIDSTLPDKLADLTREATELEEMWMGEKDRAEAAERDLEHLRSIIQKNPDWAHALVKEVF